MGCDTFLFTDIENSTGLWDTCREEMSELLERHDSLTMKLVDRHGGTVVKHTGDGFFIHFSMASSALACAVELIRDLAGIAGEGSKNCILARAGIHTGIAVERRGDFFGPAVNLAQRVMASGSGGQILVTGDFLEAMEQELPAVSFRDLGMHRLTDLSKPRRLFLVEAPGLPRSSSISPKTLGSVPNNLKRPLTPFVGRKGELLRIFRLLERDDVRFLSLHGHGGTGKTRLALQAGAMEAFSFPDGVFHADMEKVDTEEGALWEIGRALGLDPQSDGFDRSVLEKRLTGKRILLILDGCDSLAGHAGELASFLSSLPGLKMLATSRIRLGLSCEHVFQVGGMTSSAGSGTSDGEILFRETAGRAQASTTEASPNDEAVKAICSLLGGNPLAIVLVASWTGMLSYDDILRELDNPLAVSAELSDLPERHRSLREVFRFSWNHLIPGERRVLASLSVFDSAFSLADALEVSSTSRTDLSILLGKSLLEKREDGLFRLHPLVRDFAWEKTAEVLSQEEKASLVRSHAERFLGLLLNDSEALQRGDCIQALKRLTPCKREIIAAWERSVAAGSYPVSTETAGALRALLGLLGMYTAGEKLFRESLEAYPGDSSEFRGAMHSALGWFCSFCSTRDESIRQLKKAVELYREADSPGGLGDSLNMLGNVHYIAGMYKDAADAYCESLNIRKGLGDDAGVAAVLNNLGNLAFEEGDFAAAQRYYRESLETEKRSGNTRGASSTLTNLAIVAIELNRLDEAREMLEMALEEELKIGDDFNAAIVKGVFCTLHLKAGEYRKGEELCRENIETYTRLGNRWGLAESHRVMGEIDLRRGSLEGARANFLLALHSVSGRGWTPLSLEIMGGSVMVLLEAGQEEDARELAGFIAANRSAPGRTVKRMKTLPVKVSALRDLEEAQNMTEACLKGLSISAGS
ncbi:MAG TPA: tetratricopeptide repeat protein [Candidatus Sabulitectum sp.]|nr:tetratricopeptide repeat protein [Candidatus Sabulitectum sp.]HPJ27825.1 tetratricopeptide repeat protein [Candidatus Sabulitectum sp.]HPR21969.1 tetratricopeptide repeat protein [Candidatus Sabulitectum sp.]